MEKYLRIWKERMGVASTQIVSSRGCPFSCRFCSKNTFGKRARSMSYDRVIEEMRLIYDKYKVEMIFFDDDLFTLDRKRVFDFCDAMEKKLPGKKWWAQAGLTQLIWIHRLGRQAAQNHVRVESGSQGTVS
jgi:radical SAM superfamily enzyme YgiQ (UPF0313 family)